MLSLLNKINKSARGKSHPLPECSITTLTKANRGDVIAINYDHCGARWYSFDLEMQKTLGPFHREQSLYLAIIT